MPGRDGTGPLGEGPRTGGGWGRCDGPGRGRRGVGFGWGRGLRGRWAQAPSDATAAASDRAEEESALRRGIEALQRELERLTSAARRKDD